MNLPDEEGNHGRYDAECEKLLREIPGAHTVLLIVVGGEKGGGFSVATADSKMLAVLPVLLEDVALSIRQQLDRAASQ